MSHSMETTNFKLPLFADNDSPTWLGDFNEAMGTMDTAMAKVSNDSNSQVNAIANLTTRVEDCEEKVVEIDNKVKGYDEAIAGKAPVLHADATVKYGAASADLYGHVRLEDAPGDYSAGDGRAATPKALKTVNDAATAAQSAADAAKKTAETANTAAQNAQKTANDAAAAASAADTKAGNADRKAQQALDLIGQGGGSDPSGSFAPVKHDDSTNKYGQGSTTKFGHVKLTDTVGNTGASTGTAVSPLGVKNYVDNAIESLPSGGQVQKWEKSTTYGSVTATYRDGLVVVRLYGNYSGSDIGSGAIFKMTTLPSELRPVRQYFVVCDVNVPGTGNLGCSCAVENNGDVQIYYRGETKINTLQFNCEIVYYAGV